MAIDNYWFLYWCFGYEAKRKRLLKKAPAGPLRDFLSAPFPKPSHNLADVSILSVDFETTGLNAKKDQILSVGFVECQNNQVKLSSCYHQVIKTKGQLNADNVVIHQITDQQKNLGQMLRQVVENLLNALAGKVMLAHFSAIERQFLNQACIELYGMAPVFPIIDTLAIAKRRRDKQDIPYDPSQLRLSNLRNHYNLPKHFSHNALNDAIATAELLMVQANELSQGNNLRLAQLL